jgi:hypothetical protein
VDWGAREPIRGQAVATMGKRKDRGRTASVMNAYVSEVDVTSAGMTRDSRLEGRESNAKRVRKVSPTS